MNELLLSAESVRLIHKIVKKQKCEKGETKSINYYLEVLYQDIPGMKVNVENLATGNEHLDKEFKDFVYEADKNTGRVSLLLSNKITLEKN